MEIHDKSFFIKSSGKIHLGKNFLFNQYLYDKEDKKIDKLNCFDIYEEFEIYYRIHFEKKNNKSLNWLISSVIINIKSGNEESDFSLFLILFIKNKLIVSNIKQNIDYDNLLTNIKNKGDLSKISKNELRNIVTSEKKR
mgnify:CR=1 FL=1